MRSEDAAPAKGYPTSRRRDGPTNDPSLDGCRDRLFKVNHSAVSQTVRVRLIQCLIASYNSLSPMGLLR